MEGLSLGQRLLAAYDTMPRGERRLADLLLEDTNAVRHFSASELAARAGVSKATAARLFRRLGYLGFKQAQREVRAGEHARGQIDAAAPGRAVAPSAYLDTEVKHLVRTFEHLRSDDLEQAVRRLRQGEKLWVVGFGDDYPLAHLARSQLIKLRPDVRMLPIGGFPIAEEFASISDADTVLALGVGPRTAALRNIMGSATRAGAFVILLTESLGGADRATSSLILRCRCSGPTLFGSLTAAASLITYLCASLAARLGAPAVNRLQAIEEIHAEWRDLSGGD